MSFNTIEETHVSLKVSCNPAAIFLLFAHLSAGFLFLLFSHCEDIDSETLPSDLLI